MGGPKLSVPVLHGLTADQLEAIRGYTETVAAVASVRRKADTLASQYGAGDAPPVTSVRLVRMAFLNLANLGMDDSPYSDGAHYAMGREDVERSVRHVEALLVGWKR